MKTHFSGPSVSISIDQLIALAQTDEAVQRMVQRLTALDYSQFKAALYDDLEFVFCQMEQNPQLYGGQGEDQLNVVIADKLACMHYTATHGTSAGGHTDLDVRIRRFRWIGEAKIFHDVTSLKNGFEQLTTRYTPGQDGNSRAHGGLIAYLHRPEAAEQMSRWRSYLTQQGPVQITSTSDCARRGTRGFLTEHLDVRFSIPFETWHACISLHFNPQDASARARKSRS